MARNISHHLLDDAKTNKKDEFYTQLADIERELKHYKNHFQNKVVYCNCDDPRSSNFFKYFVLHFKELGLKKIIASCYKKWEYDLFSPENFHHAFYYEYTGKENPTPSANELKAFNSDGDFRSEESVRLLKESDIVETNPPFSLFREYVAQLIFYKKQFLIIGNINAITYKEIFNLIKDNKVWLGIHLGRGISGFILPEHYELYGTETKTSLSPKNTTATKAAIRIMTIIMGLMWTKQKTFPWTIKA